MSNRPEWFAPKSHGFGSGMPIAWQGWAVLIGYLALVAGSIPLARTSIVAHLGLVATATVVLCVICARTTRGGWRWRWGEKD